jgi:hypothetical protein
VTRVGGGGGGAAGACGGTGTPGPGFGCRFDEKSGISGLRPFRFMESSPRMGDRPSTDSTRGRSLRACSYENSPLIMSRIVSNTLAAASPALPMRPAAASGAFASTSAEAETA